MPEQPVSHAARLTDVEACAEELRWWRKQEYYTTDFAHRMTRRFDDETILEAGKLLARR